MKKLLVTLALAAFAGAAFAAPLPLDVGASVGNKADVFSVKTPKVLPYVGAVDLGADVTLFHKSAGFRKDSLDFGLVGSKTWKGVLPAKLDLETTVGVDFGKETLPHAGAGVYYNVNDKMKIGAGLDRYFGGDDFTVTSVKAVRSF